MRLSFRSKKNIFKKISMVAGSECGKIKILDNQLALNDKVIHYCN